MFTQYLHRNTRWIVVGAILGAILSLVNPEPNSRLLYAYTTGKELVVVDGSTTVAEVPGDFTQRTWLTWTFDGRYVAALEGYEPEKRKVVTVDGLTGSVTKYDCSRCTSISAIAENRLLAAQPDPPLDSVVLAFNLGTGEPPISNEVRGLEGINAWILLESLEGQVFAAGSVRNALHIYSIYADGQATRHESLVDIDTDVFTATATRVGIDGRTTLAVQTPIDRRAPSDDYCTTDSISIVNADTGDITYPSVWPITTSRSGKGVAWAIETYDLWWDRGDLYWRLALVDCEYRKQPVPGPNLKARADIWRLRGDAWVQVKAGLNDKTLAEHKLQDGTYLRLDHGGALYIKQAGGKEYTFVALQVSAIVTPKNQRRPVRLSWLSSY